MVNLICSQTTGILIWRYNSYNFFLFYLCVSCLHIVHSHHRTCIASKDVVSCHMLYKMLQCFCKWQHLITPCCMREHFHTPYFTEVALTPASLTTSEYFCYIWGAFLLCLMFTSSHQPTGNYVTLFASVLELFEWYSDCATYGTVWGLVLAGARDFSHLKIVCPGYGAHQAY